jgi:hypothetical protein
MTDNVDTDVNDNNEAADIQEEEDDAGLDHEGLDLSREQYMQLKYKFNELNPEVDIAAPKFKVSMHSPHCQNLGKHTMHIV